MQLRDSLPTAFRFLPFLAEERPFAAKRLLLAL
jgi:hypothetical protein